MYPIYVNYNAESDSVIIDRNFIYNIHHSSVTGIRVNRVRSWITNNMVYLTGEANTVQALRLDGGAENRTIQAYHNTVLMAGMANNAGYTLYFTGADGTFRVKNNIFINYRTSTEYDQANAFIGYSTATAPVFDLSDNIYYNANNEGFLAKFVNVFQESLEDWQTAGNFDQNSKVLNVNFVSLVNYDLHLDATYSLSSLFAGKILNVQHDFDDQERGVIPYIGADELATAPFPFYDLSIIPEEIDFEEVALGFSRTDTVTIVNNSINLANIDSIVAPLGWNVKVDDSEFNTILYDIYLAGNDIKDLIIKLEPNTMGIHSGNVSIYVGVQRFDIVVNAMAISADLSISSELINVGSTPILIPLEYSPFTVHNISDIEQTVSIETTGDYQVRITGQQEWNQSINNLMIPEGDSLQFDILFTPQSYNFHNDTIFVTTFNFTFICKLVGRSLGVKFNGTTATPFLRVYNGESVWGDFDGDGFQDVAVSGYQTVAYKGFMDIYKNMGNGVFESVGQDFTGLGSCALAWIDIDNDGDLDMFAAGQDTMNTRKTLLIENQNGTFIENESENIPGMSGGSVAVADFNKDGYMDLLVTGEEYVEEAENIAHTHIYLNNKQGDFELFGTNLPQITTGHASVIDFNNDGLVDIALAGRVGSFDFITKVLRNEGNGTFSEIELPDVLGLRYSKIRWGDYDANGLMDILVTGSYDNQQNSISYIYKNNGDETFSKAYEFPGVRLGDIQWADLDNNGHLDIIMNGIFNDAVWLGRIYVYVPEQQAFTLVDTVVDMRASNISLCDFNNDNSVDFMLTGRYDYQDYRTILYQNKWHILNTEPAPPASIDVSIGNSMLYISWPDGNDEESPVTYNLRIGSSPGASDIFNCYANPDGAVSVPSFGNMGTSNSALLPWNHNGTFYASVQSVDASFKGSAWSAETSFVGNSQIVHNNSVRVFPNTAHKYIYIEALAANSGCITIEIADMTGKIWQKELIESNAGLVCEKIELSEGLSSGMYIINITSLDKTESKLLHIK